VLSSVEKLIQLMIGIKHKQPNQLNKVNKIKQIKLNSMMKNTFYIVFNLIYQLGSFFLFLYANTYLNEALVPKRLMWKDNKPRTDSVGLGGVVTIKTLALIVEAAVLILLIYFVNKLILSDTEEKDRRNVIANWTAKINIILSLCFIAILIWGSFRGYLW